MAAGVDRKLAAIANALESAVGDLAFGGAVLVLIAVGTGVYVRRFEIWLEARSSGEAVALGSTDLSDAALAANEQANRFLK